MLRSCSLTRLSTSAWVKCDVFEEFLVLGFGFEVLFLDLDELGGDLFLRRGDPHFFCLSLDPDHVEDLPRARISSVLRTIFLQAWVVFFVPTGTPTCRKATLYWASETCPRSGRDAFNPAPRRRPGRSDCRSLGQSRSWQREGRRRLQRSEGRSVCTGVGPGRASPARCRLSPLAPCGVFCVGSDSRSGEHISRGERTASPSPSAAAIATTAASRASGSSGTRTAAVLSRHS